MEEEGAGKDQLQCRTLMWLMMADEFPPWSLSSDLNITATVHCLPRMAAGSSSSGSAAAAVMITGRSKEGDNQNEQK